jgi:putative ABC transport system substrate-binding protein
MGGDLDQAFADAAARADGLVVATDAAFTTGGSYFPDDPLIALPLRYRVPTMYSLVDAYVASGGLMGYGANVANTYVRAATFVDKVLKGASAAELPIEQAMKLDFGINLKTAQALGIMLPDDVMTQATVFYQ